VAQGTYFVPKKMPDTAVKITPGSSGLPASNAGEHDDPGEALRQSEESYRTILESIEDGYYEVDLAGNLTFFNDSLCKIYGYSRDELIGMNNRHYMSPETSKKTFEIFNKVYRTGEPNRIFDWEFIKKDKSIVNVEISVSLTKNAAGERIGFRGIVRDVSERKRSEERIRYLANYDSLTGLLNRALFRDRLTHAMERARRQQGIFAVLFLDLDRFKLVNDTLGHSIGDELLCETAKRIKGCLRESDTVARLGGDEFVVMLEDIQAPDGAGMVARRVLQALARPVVVEGKEIYSSASIGITIYPFDAQEIEGLLRNADTAMYLAKERGRNNYQFFTSEMNARAQERALLENGLRRALEREELVLFYQPRVDMRTNALTGFEALLRWQHPELGMITPDKFIPIAEETSMIVPIGEWVLRAACRQWRRWQDARFDPVDMAVNISVIQFRYAKLAETVQAIVKDTGMDPRRLELELTETALMTSPELCRKRLVAMKDSGIRFAIDDFGTGYSSLAYLRRFPIDTLKIDRSFVKDVRSNSDGAAIVHAIISLGHTLRMKVVAEGVETAEQRDFLLRHDCRDAQGYLFSRPLPAEAATEWLKGRRGQAANVSHGAMPERAAKMS
jgi:diguanylate cyclase (GGDEF)-like protein/PAS domain S-box-containing protein